MNKEEGYLRKQFIEDAIRVYIRNNPEEFSQFKELSEKRRTGLVSEYGELKTIVNGKIKADEDNFRLAVSLPSKLFNTLETILNADKVGLFEEKKELHWFMRKFPEFTIPKKI